MHEIDRDKIKEIPFFFIIGRPRSGTTLLRTLFDAHPNVMIPDECAMIVHLAPDYINKKYWTEKTLLEFYSRLIKMNKLRRWGIEKEVLKNILMEQWGKTDFISIIKRIYLQYKSFYQKKEIKIIGDKNPSYALHFTHLFKVIPDAKFIFLIRDPRDNILSIKKLDFEAPITSLIAYRWRYSIKLIEYFKSRFPSSFYTIRYEDLVNDPKSKLLEMCDFLGLEFHENMLNHHSVQDQVMTAVDKEKFLKFHAALLNPINTSKVNNWKKEMSPFEIKQVEFLCKSQMDYFGYVRTDSKASIIVFITVLPAIVYGTLYNFISNLSYRLPYSFRILISGYFVKTLNRFLAFRKS